jgi:phosphoribosylaminoimidazole-succinocarboxamide synthase
VDGLTMVRQGKVRDMYRTQAGIVMVASDRISAYDVVLPQPDGPTRTRNSPSLTSRVRSLTATTSGLNRL